MFIASKGGRNIRRRLCFSNPQKRGRIDKQSLPTQGKCNATQMKKDQLEGHSPLPNVTRKIRTKTQIMSVTVETTHRLPLLTGKIA